MTMWLINNIQQNMQACKLLHADSHNVTHIIITKQNYAKTHTSLSTKLAE